MGLVSTIVTRSRSINKTARRSKKPEPAWWEGRRVAIFPDIPGEDFRPEHSILIRTEQAREIVNEVVAAIFRHLSHDHRPEWLVTGS